jgi:hypothetical protein
LGLLEPNKLPLHESYILHAPLHEEVPVNTGQVRVLNMSNPDCIDCRLIILLLFSENFYTIYYIHVIELRISPGPSIVYIHRAT